MGVWGRGAQFSLVPPFREEHEPESLDENLGSSPGLAQSLSVTGPRSSWLQNKGLAEPPSHPGVLTEDFYNSSSQRHLRIQHLLWIFLALLYSLHKIPSVHHLFRPLNNSVR